MSDDAPPLAPLAEEARPYFDWLKAPHLKRIVEALEAATPGSARFVGGCVRDSLLEVAPKDFDIATTLTPPDVVSALERAGLRAAPTGLEHGTVTAIADHQGVEITTLRADVSTDGRRAVVAFTKDWAVDASRRDFRINAIYLTPGGQLFDPVGGVADARARRVRFIGDAEQRIKEDYLRILRFFRFSARLSDAFDEEGLRASIKHKDGLERLSAERIGAEIMAILALPRAAFAIAAMVEGGVLSEIWPAAADVATLRRLKATDPGAPAPLALAALFGREGEGIGARLRLSNAENAIRESALTATSKIAESTLTEQRISVLIYRLGAACLADGRALAAARGDIAREQAARIEAVLSSWTPPAFNLSGRHIIAAGVAPGPAVAKILKAVEAQWIDEGFPGENRVSDILVEQIAAHR